MIGEQIDGIDFVSPEVPKSSRFVGYLQRTSYNPSFKRNWQQLTTIAIRYLTTAKALGLEVPPTRAGLVVAGTRGIADPRRHRGVRGNSHPYRAMHLLHCMSPVLAQGRIQLRGRLVRSWPELTCGRKRAILVWKRCGH
jgi:hypothetical protein